MDQRRPCAHQLDGSTAQACFAGGKTDEGGAYRALDCGGAQLEDGAFDEEGRERVPPRRVALDAEQRAAHRVGKLPQLGHGRGRDEGRVGEDGHQPGVRARVRFRASIGMEQYGSKEAERNGTCVEGKEGGGEGRKVGAHLLSTRNLLLRMCMVSWYCTLTRPANEPFS